MGAALMAVAKDVTGRQLAVALAGLVLAALTGCGDSNRPYPVNGQLVYEDGQPVTELTGFTVTFTSEKLGKSAVGQIQEDGTFRLTTTRQDDGAFPGDYLVIVSQPHPNPERREFRKPAVDLAYEDLGRTDLKATVEPKGNEFTFRLRRLKPPPK